MDSLIPLTRVYRGERVESQHHGRFLLLEDDRVVASGGDPERHVFYRSSSKALQALVCVTSGAADRFGFGAHELALAAGSHSGTPDQVALAASMLKQAEIPEALLRCGPQWPYDRPSAKAAHAAHDAPRRIWNNCSGKHAAMLASARAMGAPLETYVDVDHPVQVEIRRHIAALADVDAADVGIAVDGCSAPTFSLPMRPLARSVARLVDPAEIEPALREAAVHVRDAWSAHPHLIAGPGRFDTVLMEGVEAHLLVKSGAEGVVIVAHPERRGVLVVKCEDGNDRGAYPFTLALLERYGFVSPAEAERVTDALGLGTVKNREGLIVGRVEAVLPPRG